MVRLQRIQRAFFTLTFTLILSQGGGPIGAQDSLPFDTVLDSAVSPAEPARMNPSSSTNTPITATEPLTSRLTNGWVGRLVGELVDELVDYGWLVVTETPSLVQLDRHNQSLDLHVDRSRGAVIEVEVVSP